MYVTSPINIYENAELITSRFLAQDAALLSHVSHVDEGQPLFCEGDDADYIYEILEGVVRTSKLLSDGAPSGAVFRLSWRSGGSQP